MDCGVTAIDGLVLDVVDTHDNEEEFGRSGNDTAPSPFPQVRLVALGECGTHAAVDAALATLRYIPKFISATCRIGLIVNLSNAPLLV